MTRRHSRNNKPKTVVVTNPSGTAALVRVRPSLICPYNPHQTHAQRHRHRHKSAMAHIGDIAEACDALGVDMLFTASPNIDQAEFRFVYEAHGEEYVAHWVAARAWWRNGLSNMRNGEITRVFDYEQLIEQLHRWTQWCEDQEAA